MAKRQKRIAFLYKKQDGICFYCGGKMNRVMNHPNAASIDHKIPRVFGVHNNNTVACCRKCNVNKAALDAETYLKLKNNPEALYKAKLEVERIINPQ